MPRTGQSNGREKTSLGFQTPGMLKIISDVHALVDEHRARNGQQPWDWIGLTDLVRAKKLRFKLPTWIAKFAISNHGNQVRQGKAKHGGS